MHAGGTTLSETGAFTAGGWVRVTRQCSRVLGFLVILIGAGGIAGWVWDVAVLKSVFSGYVSIKPNTALGLILVGVGLSLLQESSYPNRTKEMAGRLCAAAACAIGLVTLGQYVSGLDLGIDRLLFEVESNSGGIVGSGRMAPESALNFLVAGVALLLMDMELRRGFRPTEGLAVVVGVVAFVPFVLYLYGASPWTGVIGSVPLMALNSSAGFLLAALGIMFARPERGVMALVSSNTAAGMMVRLIFGGFIVVFAMTGALSLITRRTAYFSMDSMVAIFFSARVILVGATVLIVARYVQRLETKRSIARREVQRLNRELEQKVAERTAGLEAAQATLSAERDFAASVVQTVGALVVVLDRDGRIVQFNRACEAATGYSFDEIRDRLFWDVLLLPEETQAVRNVFLKLCRGDFPSEFENCWKARDGSRRLIAWRNTCVADTRGDVTHIIGTGIEITERRQAEDAQRLNESRLEALLKLNQMARAPLQEITDFALEEGVRLTRSKMGYLAFMNDDETVLTMHSWSRGAMAECAIRDKPLVYTVAETGLWGEAVRQRRPAITNDYAAPSTLKKGYPDGHVHVSRHMSVPIFDEGRIVILAGAGNKEGPYDESDVRQLTLLMEGMWRLLVRKRIEDEMGRLRRYLQNIIDSMPSMLIGVDMETKVTHWNREAALVTGIPESGSRGQHLDEAVPLLADQLARIQQAIRAGVTLENVRLASRNGDGEMKHFELMVYPLLTNGTEGAVIRLDDITRRVQIEEMMVQTEKMMSVGGLAAGMAHEINNPLGGILQACQNIERRTSSELPGNADVARASGTDIQTIRRYLEERGILRFIEGIRTDGARAAKIVADMLSYSRRSESKVAPVALTEAIETALRLAAHDYDLKKQYDFRKIEIVREFDPGVPPVRGEQTKIAQVLLNLIKNAAQAMSTNPRQQSPRITIRLTGEESCARIDVIDNGPGMDEATRRRVFEPFFTTKEVGIGTGLGLSVSYFIVTTQQGGTLSVESGPGQGARFIVRLPFEPGE